MNRSALVMAAMLLAGCKTVRFGDLHPRAPFHEKIEINCAEYPGIPEEINQTLTQRYADGWRIVAFGDVTTSFFWMSSSAPIICMERVAVAGTAPRADAGSPAPALRNTSSSAQAPGSESRPRRAVVGPLATTAPPPSQSPPPSMPPPARRVESIAPTDSAVENAIAAQHRLLLGCRDTYAKAVEEVPTILIVASDGSVIEVQFEEIAEGSNFATCLRRTLRLVRLGASEDPARAYRSMLRFPPAAVPSRYEEPARLRPSAPSEGDIGQAIDAERELLTSCHDVYAKSVAEIPVTLLIETDGSVRDVEFEGIADSSNAASCLRRVLRLLRVPPFKSAPRRYRHVLQFAPEAAPPEAPR